MIDEIHSIDQGSSFDKAVRANSVYNEPAVITNIGDNPRVSDRICVNGKWFVGGYSAVKHSGRRIDEIQANNDYHGSPIQELQICWILNKLGVKSGHYKVLVVSVPSDKEFDERLIKTLTERKKFEFLVAATGNTETITYDRILIKAQSLGQQAFWEYVVRDKNEVEPERVINFDIGSYTTDITDIEWNDDAEKYDTLANTSGSLRGNISMNTFLAKLKEIMLNKNAHLVFDYFKMSKLLWQEKYTLQDGSEKINFYDDFLKVKEWFNKEAIKCFEPYSDSMRVAEKIVVAGGASKFIDIDTVFYKEKTVVLDTLANAKGQLILAQQDLGVEDIKLPSSWLIDAQVRKGAVVGTQVVDSSEVSIH